MLISCSIGPSLTQSSLANSVLNNVASPYYPWSKKGNANFSIAIPTPLTMSFSTHFSANPTHDFYIGLYSPNFIAQCALGPYTPDAIIELYISGWDNGVNNTQRNAAYFGIYTETGYYRKKIFFADTATSQQKYIIPGTPGGYIEYIYTMIASATECNVILEYLDPLTAKKNILLSLTKNDFPPDILAIIQAPSFPGFTRLGFHTYDVPYNVQNTGVTIPQSFIDSVRNSIAVANTILSSTMQQNVQNICSQATATIANANSLPNTTIEKNALLATAIGIQTRANNDRSFIAEALAILSRDFIYNTPSDATATKALIDGLIPQLTSIAQNYMQNAATLQSINTNINKIRTNTSPPSTNIDKTIETATIEACASITQALAALSQIQSLLQETDTQAHSALTSALLLPITVSNRQTLIETAERIQTNPTTGTINYLNYIANSIAILNNAPRNYENISDARAMRATADAIISTSISISQQNNVIQSNINNLQFSINSAQKAAELINQMNEIATANTAAQQSIKEASASLINAQRITQTSNIQAAFAITAAQTLPPFPAIDTSSLILTAQALQNDPVSGTSTSLNIINNLIQTLQALPTSFTNIHEAQAAQEKANTAKKTADNIVIQNSSLLATINNVNSMISDVSNVISNALLNNATITANAHIATAIAAIQNTQLLIKTSNKQVGVTIAIIDALPDSAPTKSDLLRQATALITTSDITKALSASLATLKTFPGSYDTVLLAQSAQKIADDASSAALALAKENETTLSMLYEIQNNASTAQTTINNDANAVAFATATTHTHIAAAITSVQKAQLITKNANIEAQQVIAAAQDLPEVVDNKKDLLVLATELLTPSETLSYLSSSLGMLQQTSPIFTSVSDALKAQSTADSIKSHADDIIKQNTNTLTALANAQQAITQAHNNAIATTLAIANAITVAHIESTIQTLQEALSLSEQVRLQSEAVTASAQTLSDSVSVKQNFLTLVNNLVVDPATTYYLNTTLSRLQGSKTAFTTLNEAQNVQLNADAINGAAHAITVNLQNSLGSLMALQDSINAAALTAATTDATNHILLAMTALENAKALMRTADQLAQDAITAAQTLPNNQALLIQAYQLRTDANTGTQALLTLIQNAMNTLQALPTTFTTTIDASNTQNSAYTLCATAQQIIAGAPSILNTIAAVQALILAAQKQTPSTPDPSQNPTPTPAPGQTLLPSGVTPLERLTITIALELTAAQQTLIEAQNAAVQAYALITQIITDIATSPASTVSTTLLPTATSLKSAITTILNKITATQTSLAKQSPPFASQALALKARAIVESSANYARTALNLIDARRQSINSLQSQIVPTAPNT